MKRIFFSWLFLAPVFCLFAQDDISAITDSITAEGKRLFRTEMASWYGTDIFLETYKDRDKIGGYFSYSDGDTARCIFFSKPDDSPVVIGTISFDSTYDLKTAKTDFRERPFSNTEKELYIIRTKALDIINSGDTLFKFYKNTNLNLIPLISNGEKKVYVLTGPSVSGVVIFGNDYILRFDDQNQLVSKKQLHKNIISVEYDKPGKEDEVSIGAVHSHLPETGEFMTATDICTIMLYAKFAKWKQHMVVSQHYLNIWNCETNTLVAITREAVDRINEDQKKKEKKNKDQP